jgi:hypothetical protein
VNWIKVSPESEWVYFGAEGDVNETIAMQKIREYFSDSPVFVAIDRKHSAGVQLNELQKFLHGILGHKNFFIWDQSFKRAIEFSRIGVMRQGYI